MNGNDYFTVKVVNIFVGAALASLSQLAFIFRRDERLLMIVGFCRLRLGNVAKI